MLAPIRQQEQNRRLKDRESGKHDAPLSHRRISRQKRGYDKRGKCQDERQRHRALQKNSTLEQGESRQRPRQQYRRRLTEEIAG